MSLFLVYMFLTIPKLIGLFKGFAIISVALWFAIGLYVVLDNGNPNQRVKHYSKLPWVCAICACLAVLTPTKDEAIILAGAYAVVTIVENPAVQETSGKVMTLINQKLDEALAEKPSAQ